MSWSSWPSATLRLGTRTEHRAYLHRYALHRSVEGLERALIEEGLLHATGWRWLGVAAISPRQ